MRIITNKRICESCGTTDGGDADQKLLECAGCLSSYFCNTQCQQQSWPLHKKICRQRKKSVVKIQSNWRGWYTRMILVMNDGQDRCEVCGALDSKDKQLNICNGCKLSLFCSVRCQEYAWKKKNHNIICQERQKAALKIQSAWRASILQLMIRSKSAVKIQSTWRDSCYRLAEAKRKKEKNSTAFRHTLNCIVLTVLVWMKLDEVPLKETFGICMCLLIFGILFTFINDELELKYLLLSEQKLFKATITNTCDNNEDAENRSKLQIDNTPNTKDGSTTSATTTDTTKKDGFSEWDDVSFEIIVLALFGSFFSIMSRYTISMIVLIFAAIAFSGYETWSIYGTGALYIGTLCMYKGRAQFLVNTFETFETFEMCETTYLEWGSTFWLGETIVMWSLICGVWDKAPRCLNVVLVTVAPLLTLWLCGSVLRYAILLVMAILYVVRGQGSITFVMGTVRKDLTPNEPRIAIIYNMVEVNILVGFIASFVSEYTPMTMFVIALWLQMIYSAYKGTLPRIDNAYSREMIAPLFVDVLGMCCLHIAHSQLSVVNLFAKLGFNFDEVSEESDEVLLRRCLFWLGESLLLLMIMWHARTKCEELVLLISVPLLSLWLQGRILRYVMVVLLELLVAFVSIFFETKPKQALEAKGDDHEEEKDAGEKITETDSDKSTEKVEEGKVSEKEEEEEKINITTQLQADKRKKKTFKGKKKRMKVT